MTRRLGLPLAVALLTVALVAACGKRLVVAPVPNVPPTVRITSGPVDTNEVCRPRAGVSCYSLTFHWIGFDPDGRVDSYRYALDPPDQGDTTWIETTAKEKRFVFEADRRSGGADSLTLLRGYHVLVVRAVDDRGASSPPAFRAFFSWTTAPTVRIVTPRPRGTVQSLPPSIRISWDGYDDDASDPSKRPVRYKYLMLGPGNESLVVPGGIPAIVASPALIRRYYAPQFRAQDGWVTVSGDTLSAQFSELVPGAKYLFIVVAFDETGAYSPVFEISTNLLYFTATYGTSFGPTMTVFNEAFYYTYGGGGFNPANEVHVDAPAGQAISVFWSAAPPAGGYIVAYEWMLDGNPFVDAVRGQDDDLQHWSTPSNVTSTTIGPFGPGEHLFYVKALDNTGLWSLATVHFSCVAGTFTKPLLIVDDTRRPPDSFNGDGTVKPSPGQWPSAAELDTFMYAIGGVPWRRAPQGMLSPRGILAGYAFDTLGTLTTEPTLSLSTLGSYRHVIWLEDFESARFTNGFGSTVDPITLLSWMTLPRHVNELSAYIQLGGEVWLLGGGGALATLLKFNDLRDDTGGNIVFNATSDQLVAGRFMYSVAHWQSQIRDRSSVPLYPTGNIQTSLGRFTSHPGLYADVPLTFDARTMSSDPVPPYRTASSFYPTAFMTEYLDVPNEVIEEINGDPDVDFMIDAFDDADASAVLDRWRSSDSLNTVVSTVAVPAPMGGARGGALRLTTQGGGASDGDVVRHELGKARDYSGLTAIHMSVRENAAGHPTAWRVRLFDAAGHTESAPVPATGPPGDFVPVDVRASTFVSDAGSRGAFDAVRVTSVALVLDHGDAAAATDIDDVRATTTVFASVLDTLLGFKTYSAALPFAPIMTVYHGHDFPKPFVFTGFAPWSFKRSQCQALFDFVLGRLWGLSRDAAGANASRRRSAASAVAAPPPARVAPTGGLRRRR